MRRIALLSFCIFVAAPGNAQVQPVAGDGDPHLQTVEFHEGQVVQLRGAPGYQLMVELSPDEQVQNVALGDSSAWQVSINKDGSRLFLKPLLTDATTNMTVVTSVRVYNFDLGALPGPSPMMPYTVQFRYPAPKLRPTDHQYVDVSQVTRRLSRYGFGGDRGLRPSSVSNDGQRTYIVWPRSSAIPAVYALDQYGKESVANGMMGTDDTYVVDGVPDKLTFRIDRSLAWAKRLKPRKSH